MYQRKNFAYGKVATAPSPATSGTSLVLEIGQGARFPNTTGGTYVNPISWWDGGTDN